MRRKYSTGPHKTNLVKTAIRLTILERFIYSDITEVKGIEAQMGSLHDLLKITEKRMVVHFLVIGLLNP